MNGMNSVLRWNAGMKRTFAISLKAIGPGVLVAATGVGAGDLAGGAFAGGKLGMTVLWAVLVGAGLKLLLTEGLARWQLVTGTTLLEGCVAHLGRFVRIAFLIYLVIWSYLVSMALMNAAGATMTALLPLTDDPVADKQTWGIMQSLAAAVLVWIGGFRLFEKVMSACIGIMFVTVIVTAASLQPDAGELLSGLLAPWKTPLAGDGLAWTVALIGGVGGTVTVLCYGYWIREEGRADASDLPLCRTDLAAGYLMTALFGVAMVVIGAEVGELPGSGSTLIVEIGDVLAGSLGDSGAAARWAFLIGAWGAVFSSLLGVWQSVPYLFCDLWGMLRENEPGKTAVRVDTQSWLYRWHLLALAVIPISGLLLVDFQTAMKVYAVAGALFVPMLAAALLLLNGRRSFMAQHRNSLWTTLLLIATLGLFVVFGYLEVSKRFG
jgi:Mn2+/Fe2+ NRAMP family transporter